MLSFYGRPLPACGSCKVSPMGSDKEFFMKNYGVGKGLQVVAAWSGEAELLPVMPLTELWPC